MFSNLFSITLPNIKINLFSQNLIFKKKLLFSKKKQSQEFFEKKKGGISATSKE
jgi:hypothetical protein